MSDHAPSMSPDPVAHPAAGQAHDREHACALHGIRSALDRRSFMRMTVGGALGMLLRPGLPELFAGETSPPGSEKSVILLWMHGGMSQIDSIDPKHDTRYAGPFKHIRTSVPGVHFTEHVPRLARLMHKMTVVRSMNSPENEHNRAQFFANTGYRPLGTLDNPSLGAMVSHELGPRAMSRAQREGLPAFISIGHTGWGSGFLGVEHAPFVVWDPNRPPDNLGLPAGINEDRIQRRLALLKTFEEGNPATAALDMAGESALGRQEARRFMTSSKAAAFRLDEEPAPLRDAYGRDGFGQGCLLARRLVETGVRFVQVHLGGWDSHANNFPVHERLLGQLDVSMSALLRDLDDRGLLDQTLVICMGEFGRTPRINSAAGRDHHPHAWSLMLSGAGVPGGQVIGASDRSGLKVEDQQITVPDLFASLCQRLEIDPTREFIAAGGRPIKLVDKGVPLPSISGGAPDVAGDPKA